MKTHHFSLLILSLSITVSLSSSQPVLDSLSNPLLPGSPYYIVSAIRGAGGGGLTLSATGNQDCPLTVTQETSDLQNGLAATFHPANATEPVVLQSAASNVVFQMPVACAESTVWRVGPQSEYERRRLILIEGEEGNPSCKSYKNWFRVEKGGFENSYNLEFYPNEVCGKFPKEMFYYLRVYGVEGKRVLGITTDKTTAFEVVFRKVERLSEAY